MHRLDFANLARATSMIGQAAPVSCYIRTLNEERLLGKVIAAVREVVDEVVVVDSGSTDATVAIAEAAGARVVHQAWLGNGCQKRFAEDRCRHDFLLDLDADEVVSAELGAAIRALFAAGRPSLPAGPGRRRTAARCRGSGSGVGSRPAAAPPGRP